MISKEDCVNDERKSLALYVLGSNVNLINSATAEIMLKKIINVQNRHERRKQRLVEW